MNVCLGIHMPMHAPVEIDINVEICCPPFFFFRQGYSVSLETIDWLEWLSSKPLEFSFSASSRSAFHKSARNPNSVLKLAGQTLCPLSALHPTILCTRVQKHWVAPCLQSTMTSWCWKLGRAPTKFIEDESKTNGRATKCWANNSRKPGNHSFCFGTREISQLSGMKPCQC